MTVLRSIFGYGFSNAANTEDVTLMSFSTSQKRSTICRQMTQVHRSLFERRQQKIFLRHERQLTNPEYAKYLYEKYKVTFSMSELQFTFNGQKFPRAEPLMKQLHRFEITEANLNAYVLGLFLVLLCAVTYGVYAIDQYLQAFR